MPSSTILSGPVSLARDPTGITSVVHSYYLAAGRIRLEYLQPCVMSSTSICSVFVQKFKNNGLLAHESEVNQLQTEGDELIQRSHPGSSAIKVHLSAVLNFRNV